MTVNEAAITTRESRTALAAPVEMGAQMMSLYQQALDKGEAGVNALEKLIDLQMKMQKSGAERSFTLALADFQEQCPSIAKSKEANIVTKSGSKYSFTYADLEEIISTIRPHLARNGFSFTFDSEATAAMLKCVCTLHHCDGHSTKASFSCPTENSSGASAQQKYGGANTYAKRQSLISVLGLSVSDPVPPGEQPESVVRVSDEQRASLLALMDEVAVASSDFCKRFKLEAVSDLPANLYAEAVRLLEKKRKAVKS